MRIMVFGAACEAQARQRAASEMAKDVSDPTKKAVERSESFTTVSGVPVERLYTPEHIRDLNYAEDLGDPGKPPYTRGIYPETPWSRMSTTRQFCGYGR